jgi:hypothetical protein
MCGESPIRFGLILFVAVLALKFVVPEHPPDASVAGNTAIKLWQENKLPELERYLTRLSQRHPNRVCAIVGAMLMVPSCHRVWR